MSQREVKAIAGRLSLHTPQTESLARLAHAIEVAPAMLRHDRDASELPAILRLMGAFISDLFGLPAGTDVGRQQQDGCGRRGDGAPAAGGRKRG